MRGNEPKMGTRKGRKGQRNRDRKWKRWEGGIQLGGKKSGELKRK